jgi:hypothetical protein
VVVAVSVGAALAVVGHDASSSCCVTSVGLARRSSRWWSASVDGVGCSRGVSVGDGGSVEDGGGIVDLARACGRVANVGNAKVRSATPCSTVVLDLPSDSRDARVS